MNTIPMEHIGTYRNDGVVHASVNVNDVHDRVWPKFIERYDDIYVLASVAENPVGSDFQATYVKIDEQSEHYQEMLVWESELYQRRATTLLGIEKVAQQVVDDIRNQMLTEPKPEGYSVEDILTILTKHDIDGGLAGKVYVSTRVNDPWVDALLERINPWNKYPIKFDRETVHTFGGLYSNYESEELIEALNDFIAKIKPGGTYRLSSDSEAGYMYLEQEVQTPKPVPDIQEFANSLICNARECVSAMVKRRVARMNAAELSKLMGNK